MRYAFIISKYLIVNKHSSFLNMLPHEIELLMEKFGPCDVIDKEERIPANFDPRNAEIALGSCVIVKDRDGKIVLIRQSVSRPDLDTEHWFFVCGKMETGESLEETGVREVYEEIGCVVRISGIHHVGHHYVMVGGNKHSIYYGAALIADLVSGTPRVNSEEVSEVAAFTRLPENFAPQHRKYYPDLC
jgi:8-oxo-dGTP pyrophosphatase MutT (NUDIX family)